MSLKSSKALPYLIITLVCVVVIEAARPMIEDYILSPKSSEQPVNRDNEQVSEGVTEKRSVPADSSIIVKRNLFGTPTEEGNKPPVVRKAAPVKPAQMDAVLMGTILTGEDNYQAVIMTKKDKKQQLVSVGEKIGEYTIVNIERGNVILDDNGREIALDMMEANQYTPRAPVERSITRQPDQNPAVRRVPKKPNRRIVVRPNSEEQIEQGEEELEQENNQEIAEDEVPDSEV